MTEFKIGQWVDVLTKTTLYDEDKREEYTTEDPFPRERGEIVNIKTHNGEKIAKLHTVIHNFDVKPRRFLPPHDYLIGYYLMSDFILVEDYENKTLEELSEEYHKMFNDWQEKYIISSISKRQEKWEIERKEREKHKEEYKEEIDFVNSKIEKTHTEITNIEWYKLLKEYRDKI